MKRFSVECDGVESVLSKSIFVVACVRSVEVYFVHVLYSAQSVFIEIVYEACVYQYRFGYSTPMIYSVVHLR
eukprot:6212836-Pleurochrysis_carterae.AAC.1